MTSDPGTQSGDAIALREALEREAATREILQVIARSRDDEKPVFDAILKNAAGLCDAPMASLNLLDETGNRLILRAHWGTALDHFEVGVSEWPLDGSAIPAQAVRENRRVQIEDFAATDLYKSGDPLRVRSVEKEGIRTFLAVPLLRSGEAIGCIALFRREVRPFDARQIDLIETFAAQAVIAIESVRQFRELQIRLEHEAATREILEVISRSRDDEKPVFDTILRNAARLCDAPMARLHVVNEARTQFTLAAAWGEELRTFRIGEQFPLNSPLGIAIAIREARTIHTEDLAQDILYLQRHPMRVKLVDEEGIRTYLTVPLVSGSVAFGSISLSRREVKPFSARDIALVQTFAAQAVIAIENVRQFKALQARTEEVQALNASLEGRVAAQVDELERMGRLKRFLSPQVAEAVVTSGDDKLLASHRAMIATLFCDMRGFTAFCETAEPEETIEVLQTYHEQMGALIVKHGAGVDHRSGDGIMVIFNDPFPCDSPAEDAVRLALAMRARMAGLCAEWRKLGHRLGFGVGISLGYATVGIVGSEGRYDYTASGTAVNLAARLCDHAGDGEILLSPRAHRAVADTVIAEAAGELTLKGIQAPVEVARVIGLKDAGLKSVTPPAAAS